MQYGVLDFAQESTDNQVARYHSVSLTGLAPGTAYQYRVTIDGVAGTRTETFTTRPTDPSQQFKFVVFGDSGLGTDAQFRIAGLIDTLQPDFLLHTGDVIYQSGEIKHYDARFFVPYKDTIKRAVMYRLDFVPEGQPVTYVVTGGGGAILAAAGSSEFTAYAEKAYHVLEVTIAGGSLHLQAIRDDRSLMDAYSKTK